MLSNLFGVYGGVILLRPHLPEVAAGGWGNISIITGSELGLALSFIVSMTLASLLIPK